MKLKTLSLLAASAGLALLLTGCNDPYHGPAYASVTIAAPLHSRPHHPSYKTYPHWRGSSRYGCRGHNCYPRSHRPYH